MQASDEQTVSVRAPFNGQCNVPWHPECSIDGQITIGALVSAQSTYIEDMYCEVNVYSDFNDKQLHLVGYIDTGRHDAIFIVARVYMHWVYIVSPELSGWAWIEALQVI